MKTWVIQSTKEKKFWDGVNEEFVPLNECCLYTTKSDAEAEMRVEDIQGVPVKAEINIIN